MEDDKRLAWDVFKNTGNINAFLEYKQIERMDNGLKDIEQLLFIDNNDDFNIEDERN